MVMPRSTKPVPIKQLDGDRRSATANAIPMPAANIARTECA
jgi:hypothetical protein